MRPLIVLTASEFAAGDYRVPQIMLGTPYLSAIEAVGGTSLLLAPSHEPASIDRILDAAHALLLTGGEDVDPSRYGEEPHPELGGVNPARDEMEIAALHRALERRMPVLAVCRGMQLLNVALGGTLYQDLPSQRPGPLVHEQEVSVDQHWHEARIEAGSALHGIVGMEELFINSFHHQAVRDLAPGLRATAWAEDGLIEGVEAIDLPWVCGVQWHPERGEANAPGDQRNPNRRLFWAFVRAARMYAEGEEAQLSTWK